MEKTAITIAIQRCHLLTFCPGGVGLSDAQKLVDLFHDLRLPTEHCDQGYLDANALESLVQRIGPPKTAQVKKVLLICGRYLEEQISFAVHYLLAKGYIIYLLRDLITAQSPEHVSIHDQRLLHAGAVSTTTRQLLYEWIASEANEGIKFRLSKVSFD
jgi:nicotinamidase-related amidase